MKTLFISFADSLPITAGYYVVAFVFGIMCINAGLPVWFPAAMCLLVYAGTAQFAALALLGAGASLITVVLSTLLINSRHILMSMYMSQKIGGVGLSAVNKSLYAFGLTDEVFAMHSRRLEDGKNTSQRYLLSFNAFCHAGWVLGGLSGAMASNYLSAVINVKLDYALTAMMIFVLVALCNTRKKLIIAAISTLTTLLINLYHLSPLNVFAATLISCGVGLCLNKRF